MCGPTLLCGVEGAASNLAAAMKTGISTRQGGRNRYEC